MTVTEYPAYTQSKEFRSGVSVETNLQVEDTTRGSVDDEGAAHLMSLLTDLYSDQEGSVIREYISNAYDSHAAAGQTRPIEVTLPGAFDPTFIVKDYGTGMSASDIRAIYLSYGKSTKRKTFNQIGAFGLGCKSALTMTQQFTLISIKDGLKNVAIITRGEDGVGEIKMITSDKPTDEPNGVEVKIPVKNYRLFNEKAEKFFFALPKDSILVDGQPVSNSLWNGDFIKIDSLNTYVSRTISNNYRYSYEDNSNTFHVIMGGVLYGVNLENIVHSLSRNARHSDFYAAVSAGYVLPTYSVIPVASLDLTPSREGIRYSDRSLAFLTALFESIAEKFIDTITQDIEAAPTRLDALFRIERYQSAIGSHLIQKVTWDGQPIPRTIATTGASISFDVRANITSVHDFRYIAPMDLAKAAKIKGDDFTRRYIVGPDVDPDSEEWKKFIAGVRRDFRGSVNLHNDDDSKTREFLYVFRKEFPSSPWITDLGLYTPVDLSTIEQEAKEWRRKRRAQGAKNRSSSGGQSSEAPQPITYPAFYMEDKDSDIKHINVSAKDLKDGDMYFEQGDSEQIYRIFDYYDMSQMIKLYEFLGIYGKHVVLVSRSRKADALISRAKDVNLVSFMSVLRNGLKDKVDSLDRTSLARVYEVRHSYGLSHKIAMLEKLRPYTDDINDPDLTKFLDLISDSSESFEMLEYVARLFGEWYTIMQEVRNIPDVLSPLVEKIEVRYPLIDFHYGRRMLDNFEHVVLYMTAVNSHRKDA